MDAQRVRQQLDRILAGTAFAEAGRADRFLRHVVEHKLEGRDGEIKESIIAIEVLGRNTSFDSKSDPIVRVEAGRLRDRLGAYYEAEGGADPAGHAIGTTFEFGPPQPLFATGLRFLTRNRVWMNQYDLSRDGQRFLMNRPAQDAMQGAMTAVIPW